MAFQHVCAYSLVIEFECAIDHRKAFGADAVTTSTYVSLIEFCIYHYIYTIGIEV